MSAVGRNHTSSGQGQQTLRTECAICGKAGYWGHRFDADHPAHSYKPVQRRYVSLDAVIDFLWANNSKVAAAKVSAQFGPSAETREQQ